MNVPDDLTFASTHEWLRKDGETGTVGISDHAQHELTDVVFVELPKLGPVTVGQQVCVIESVKAASDIYAPVSGEIVEINSDLNTTPGLINTDPYAAGWIFKLKASNSAEAAALMDAAAYRAHIG